MGLLNYPQLKHALYFFHSVSYLLRYLEVALPDKTPGFRMNVAFNQMGSPGMKTPGKSLTSSLASSCSAWDRYSPRGTSVDGSGTTLGILNLVLVAG